MGEEDKPTKEEEKKNYLKEIREERAALEKVRDEAKAVLEEAKELKAEEILSGGFDASKKPEPPKEETPQEYSKKLIEGKYVENAP